MCQNLQQLFRGDHQFHFPKPAATTTFCGASITTTTTTAPAREWFHGGPLEQPNSLVVVQGHSIWGRARDHRNTVRSYVALSHNMVTWDIIVIVVVVEWQQVIGLACLLLVILAKWLPEEIMASEYTMPRELIGDETHCHRSTEFHDATV